MRSPRALLTSVDDVDVAIAPAGWTSAVGETIAAALLTVSLSVFVSVFVSVSVSGSVSGSGVGSGSGAGSGAWVLERPDPGGFGRVLQCASAAAAAAAISALTSA